MTKRQIVISSLGHYVITFKVGGVSLGNREGGWKAVDNLPPTKTFLCRTFVVSFLRITPAS